MNVRTIELLKNPALLQQADLALLQKEIQKYPYVQSVRALHLLATHELQPDLYAATLAETAAYTTDKKILYQLINKPQETDIKNNKVVSEIQSAPETRAVDETTPETIAEGTAQNKENDTTEPEVAGAVEEAKQNDVEDKSIPELTKEASAYTAVAPEQKQPLQPVVTNGERNRILFPGEENFDSKETARIDLDATLEAGKIVLEEPEQASEPLQELAANDIPAEERATADSVELIQQKTENTAPTAPGETTPDLPTEEQPLPEEEQSDVARETQPVVPAEEKQQPSEEEPKQTPETDLPPEEQPTPEEDNPDIEQNPKPELPPEEQPTENVASSANVAAEKEDSAGAPAQVSIFEASDKATGDQVSGRPVSTVEPKSWNEAADAENFTHETVIKEDAIKQEEPVVEDHSELSFHGLQEFMPDVQVSRTAPVKDTVPQPPVQQPNRHEEEMKRLVAEVEAKMRAARSKKKAIPEPEIESHEVNFSESADFSVHTEKPEKSVSEEPVQQETASFAGEWKPMNLTIQTQESQHSQPNVEDSNIHSAEVAKDIAEPRSNVPHFVNTWQNWLKIDRDENVHPAKETISITEIKNRVIDSFIENEPKISKLKEDADFILRERSDDISHLMTETLANLYVEQKLYAKAIWAFMILEEKFPEKKKYFRERAKEMRALRPNK